MNRKFLALIVGALFSTGAIAQKRAGDAQGDSQAYVIAGGTSINAALSSPVDAKKAKEGDAVTARTTEPAKSHGNAVLPKGTELVGHVTIASARSKGDAESVLGITFDKAVLKNGQEIPLNGRIRALASGQSTTYVFDAPARRSASTVSASVPPSEHLTSKSRGVFGLREVSLDATGARGKPGSVITSNGKNVHLDGGTQMLFVTEAREGTSSTPEKATPTPEQKPDSKQPDKQ
jgi:hypothetical protein